MVYIAASNLLPTIRNIRDNSSIGRAVNLKASMRLQLHGLVTGEQRTVPPAFVPNGFYLSSYLSQVRRSNRREVAGSSLTFCFFGLLFLAAQEDRASIRAPPRETWSPEQANYVYAHHDQRDAQIDFSFRCLDDLRMYGGT